MIKFLNVFLEFVVIVGVCKCYICVCRLPVLWKTGLACRCLWCVCVRDSNSLCMCGGVDVGVCDQSICWFFSHCRLCDDPGWNPSSAGHLTEPQKTSLSFSLFECVAKIVHLPKNPKWVFMEPVTQLTLHIFSPVVDCSAAPRLTLNA